MAWQRLAWPSPGAGKPDDASRGLGFFRSYGTTVTDVSKAWPDGRMFRDHGQASSHIQRRTIGTFIIPSIAAALGILSGIGLLILPSHAYRQRALIRFETPTQDTTVFIAPFEIVTINDYPLNYSGPIDIELFTQSELYALADQPGVILSAAEEIPL